MTLYICLGWCVLPTVQWRSGASDNKIGDWNGIQGLSKQVIQLVLDRNAMAICQRRSPTTRTRIASFSPILTLWRCLFLRSSCEIRIERTTLRLPLLTFDRVIFDNVWNTCWIGPWIGFQEWSRGTLQSYYKVRSYSLRFESCSSFNISPSHAIPLFWSWLQNVFYSC